MFLLVSLIFWSNSTVFILCLPLCPCLLLTTCHVHWIERELSVGSCWSAKMSIALNVDATKPQQNIALSFLLCFFNSLWMSEDESWVTWFHVFSKLLQGHESGSLWKTMATVSRPQRGKEQLFSKFAKPDMKGTAYLPRISSDNYWIWILRSILQTKHPHRHVSTRTETNGDELMSVQVERINRQWDTASAGLL